MVLQNFIPSSGSSSNTDHLLGVEQYEANLSTASSSSRQAAVSGNNDLYYTYTYYYGNGDFYSGYGYVDAITGYYTGQVLSPSYNETYYEGYNPGYYYINSTYDYGVDNGVQNQVYVTGYYDAETASYASYLYDSSLSYGYGTGSSGLGSEVGYAYNYSLTNSDSLFGSQYYEADLYSA